MRSRDQISGVYFIRTRIYTPSSGAPLTSSRVPVRPDNMNWMRNTVAGILRNVAFLLTALAELIDVKDIGVSGETLDKTTEEDTQEEESEEEDTVSSASGYSSLNSV